MSITSTLRKIKRDFVKRSKFHRLIKDLNSEVLLTTSFKANNPKKCFEERTKVDSDPHIIRRIMEAYNKAIIAQKTFPEPYQVGNEWLPIYKLYMGTITQALTTNDARLTSEIYENFMREGCSFGLHGLPVDMNETYFNGRISKIDGEIYLHDAIYRYNLWKKLTDNKYSPSDLYMPDYGNPYGYYIDDQFIRVGAEYLHYYSTKIKELTKSQNGNKVIVELGGGYGGLGYFLNKNIPDVTYVDFDLPENMALTAYYLMSCFPNKKVLLYGEDELNEVTLKKYDIIILPNFEIGKFPTAKADLVFNSYSLSEMSAETINAYIPELKRACNTSIFHVNHTEERDSLKADDFGIEGEYKLISKNPALWNLGRNISMDEYEFLYSKI
jgi:putative sugar O-methyltransferase